MAMLTVRPHKGASLTSKPPRWQLYVRAFAMALCGSVVALSLSACSSSAESDMAASTTTEAQTNGPYYGIDQLQSNLYQQLVHDQNGQPSWTEANEDVYRQALDNTDLVYDETTASFINVEGAPATENVFRGRSQVLDPDQTSVERSPQSSEQGERNASNNQTGSDVSGAGGATTGAADSNKHGGDGLKKSFDLIEVMALAHRAQEKLVDVDYVSRWQRLEEGEHFPAPEPYNTSSIKQNKTWWQLGTGPRRTESNFYDYDPFYYRPWYVREYVHTLPYNRYQRGPRGGVYFHYTLQPR